MTSRLSWQLRALECYAVGTTALLGDGTLAVGTIDHHDAGGRRLERRRAWLALSADSGATFAEPLLVTEACSRTRFTAWPSLAVVPPRDSAPERLVFTCEADGNHGVLFARSGDRGDRWTAARRIDGGADSGWTRTPRMAVSAAGVLARFPSGGEYHGLAAVGPREFVAVWPDARGGRFRLRTVRFRVPDA